MGTLGCYLGAFVFTPLILFILLGLCAGLQFKLFITMIEQIITQIFARELALNLLIVL